MTLGTRLGRLTQLNGRPFTLSGFGWDYAGTVISWNGGRLGADSAGGRFKKSLMSSGKGGVGFVSSVTNTSKLIVIGVYAPGWEERRRDRLMKKYGVDVGPYQQTD